MEKVSPAAKATEFTKSEPLVAVAVIVVVTEVAAEFFLTVNV